MLSYPIDEAETLLDSKLFTAKTSLNNCEEDLDFIREQITVCRNTECIIAVTVLTYKQTMEVATARVYNWEVMQKRKEKKEEEEKGTEKEEKE